METIYKFRAEHLRGFYFISVKAGSYENAVKEASNGLKKEFGTNWNDLEYIGMKEKLN
jgi:hypothetical protein